MIEFSQFQWLFMISSKTFKRMNLSKPNKINLENKKFEFSLKPDLTTTISLVVLTSTYFDHFRIKLSPWGCCQDQEESNMYKT